MLKRFQFIFRMFPDKAIKGICTCGPVGYWGKAPGTNGTVVGLALYTVVFFPLPMVAVDESGPTTHPSSKSRENQSIRSVEIVAN